METYRGEVVEVVGVAAGLAQNMLPTFWHFQHVSKGWLYKRVCACVCVRVWVCVCTCVRAVLVSMSVCELVFLSLLSVDVCVDFWQLPRRAQDQTSSSHTHTHTPIHTCARAALKTITKTCYQSWARLPAPLPPAPPSHSTSVIVRLLCVMCAYFFSSYL